MKEACANCRFWDVYDPTGALNPGKLGDCRRRAPVINNELLKRSLPGYGAQNVWHDIEDNLYLPSAFPVTMNESWCGEYEPQRVAA